MISSSLVKALRSLSKHLRNVSDKTENGDPKQSNKECDFNKCELHYLGHLISGKCIYLLPETYRNIKNQVPKTPREVIQILGLPVYYHKFIPAYADIIRHLTQLTHKTVPFMWTDQYQKYLTYWKMFL